MMELNLLYLYTHKHAKPVRVYIMVLFTIAKEREKKKPLRHKQDGGSRGSGWGKGGYTRGDRR